jgi:O-antigen/teichoic acid export membrane protein
MKGAYVRTVKGISLLSFPIALWLLLNAGDFVVGFFSEKWLPAVPLFRALALYGLFRSVGATAGCIFMAQGQPKWVFRTNLLQLAIAVPLVYPVAERFGARWASLCCSRLRM